MRRGQEGRALQVDGYQWGLAFTGRNDAGDTLVTTSQPWWSNKDCAFSSRGAQGSHWPGFPSSCSQLHFSPTPPSKAHLSQLLSQTPATAAAPAGRLPSPTPFICTSLFLLPCISFSVLPRFLPIRQDWDAALSSRPGHWSYGRC